MTDKLLKIILVALILKAAVIFLLLVGAIAALLSGAGSVLLPGLGLVMSVKFIVVALVLTESLLIFAALIVWRLLTTIRLR